MPPSRLELETYRFAREALFPFELRGHCYTVLRFATGPVTCGSRGGVVRLLRVAQQRGRLAAGRSFARTCCLPVLLAPLRQSDQPI